MIANGCFYGIGFCLTPLVGLISYLWWQSRIKPRAYDEMFAVQKHAENQLDRRFIKLDGMSNCRDLGGYTNAEGQQTAWGKIYRADDLSRLTDDDLKKLSDEVGIKTVVDLRSAKETRRHPNRDLPGSTYRHIPIFKRDPVNVGLLFVRHWLDRIFKWHYRDAIVDGGAAKLGEVIKLAADPTNLPLLMHCTSGKDRTGVSAVLLLHICGIPRDVIISDYTLTNFTAEHYLDTIRGMMRRVPITGILTVEQLYPLLSARAELIEHVLHHIETKYGSLDKYLLGPVGLTPQDIATIRENILTNV